MLDIGDELKWLIARWTLDAELVIDSGIDAGDMPRWWKGSRGACRIGGIGNKEPGIIDGSKAGDELVAPSEQLCRRRH